ncbi:MAG: HNH/ENDO VII family nuclease [Lachnospiraceae bacterium]|nr:HNH/ENDO VII family nuclease [Lachnospiraceae bacterium]
MLHRPPISQKTRDIVIENAPRNEQGQILSPNTGEPYPDGTKIDMGHPPFMENRSITDFGSQAGMTQKELNSIMDNPAIYKAESASENRSHVYESHEPNQSMLNTAAYFATQSEDIASRIFIEPTEEGGVVTVVSKETGEESMLGEFYYDNADRAELSSFGEATESEATVESASVSVSMESGEDMSASL